MKQTLWPTLAFTLAAFFTQPLFSQTESVLYSFQQASRGYPEGGLIFDSQGNLYGTSNGESSTGIQGMVFELENTAGVWGLKANHVFTGTNGSGPVGSLVFDAQGNLYGATNRGGPTSANCQYGCGLVFELSPKSGGGWTEKVLHQFLDNGKDGYNPESGLAIDSAGNLYGTTQHGGTHGGGTVYEMSPKVGGGWTKTTLVNFGQPAYPNGPVILDSAGNLYGTTVSGGLYAKGRVFELSPKVGGGWTNSILYSFKGGLTDGIQPLGELVFDAAGNLYGTTSEGGSAISDGIVYEISPGVGGWTETILHTFSGNSPDGGPPFSGLVIDSEGNLYGTASLSAFELSPSNGGWTFTVLHDFMGLDGDGSSADAGLLFDSLGNLYGTTVDGGAYGFGTVFEITP